MTATLDSLPTEILLEVMSWLDWRSLQSLGRVSVHCRDAVTLHLGRLRVLRISKVHDVRLGALRELLPMLTGLRELHVDLRIVETSRKVLEALVAASRRWLQMERLRIYWPGPNDWGSFADEKYMPALLGQLCANWLWLTDVTLKGGIDDEYVVAVLAELLCLRALRVLGVGGAYFMLNGHWLAQLPAELRRLSIYCDSLYSVFLEQLARCGELRSLELLWGYSLQPDHLAAGLAGCARLERLRLTHLEASVRDCLPPTGLHALRHLDLNNCWLTDADLRCLLKRLPGLESVCLAHCHGTTPSGLALLGRLPALSSLSLVRFAGVSDWVLERLSAAPLVELELGDGSAAFTRDVTPEGLLRLTQSCPTLRTVTLRTYGKLVERVSCGPGVEERHLLRGLRAGMLKISDQRRGPARLVWRGDSESDSEGFS